MRYIMAGGSGIEVSVISLGTFGLGAGDSWNGAGAVTTDDAIKVVHAARDAGVNLLDTSRNYGFGQSERIVGQALKGRRGDFVVATKGGLVWDGEEGSFHMERDGLTVRRNLTAKSLRKQLEDSLRNLGTDYVDIYFTHWQSDDSFKTPVSETMGALMELKREGKIRAVGISNATAEHIAEYNRHGRLDAVEERYSMLYRRAEPSMLPACRENRIMFMAYSPLETGLLAGRFGMDYEVKGDVRARIRWFEPARRRLLLDMLAKWRPLCEKYACGLPGLVIAWTLCRAAFMNVICGATRPDQVRENAGYADLDIADGDLSRMTADIDTLLAEEAKLPQANGYKF